MNAAPRYRGVRASDSVDMTLISRDPGPATCVATGHGPFEPVSRAEDGDSNPRGLSPNTPSKCLDGGGKCSLGCVAAGQRGARMVRTTPGSGWIGRNCYQNCYPPLGLTGPAVPTPHAPTTIGVRPPSRQVPARETR